MSLNDFEIVKKLGSGSYSSVFKVLRRQDKKFYALKQVKFSPLKPREKENSLTEIRILASIDHPNIIKYKQAFYDEGSQTLCIVMEYAAGGDLLKRINEHKKNRTHFKASEIWDFILQITLGLKELHDRKIVHRDIKSANMFITKENTIKIGDLNVSKVTKAGLAYTQTGTPYYASPEIWKDLPYDSKSDIWSLGCVLYEMAALYPPFHANDMKSLYKKVIKCQVPPIPAIYPKDLNAFISSLIKVKPVLRPNCARILNSPTLLNNCAKFKMQKSNLILMKTISPIGDLSALLPAPKYKSQSRSPSTFVRNVSRNWAHQEDLVKVPRSLARHYKISKSSMDLVHSPINKDTIASKIRALKEHYNRREYIPRRASLGLPC